MKAIRGATTISADTPAEIKDVVGELLIQMREQNGLTDENMICILFSNTSDIKSAYPAKAAREAGFYSCALFSSFTYFQFHEFYYPMPPFKCQL